MSKPRVVVAVSFAFVLVALVRFQPVSTQQPGASDQAARFRQMSVDAERTGLAEAFKGITANGTIEPGLFALRSSGVSTEPALRAAEAFLGRLTPAQRAASTFAVGDSEWRRWMNQDYYIRQGVSFLDMSQAQREAAFDLLRASLSAKGLKQTRDIMRLNQTLGELTKDVARYGEWLYHVTIMGTPSRTEPWGWQFDGHHAVINYFVLGDQVVMTPVFAGSEPVTARSGAYAGTSVLQDEQNQGLTLVRALDATQRQKAILKVSKTGNENLTEAWKDNVVLDYAGLPGSAMTAAQRDRLGALIGLYVANMDEGHARVKMAEVRQHLDRTHFAWIGGTDPGSVFYYRIHSPVILIEFDHQVPINLRQFAANPNAPTIEHIHSVVRTPNGNDYGKDLLRQHYQQHPHGAGGN
jgi:Protein of unknown function (DUF3500)